MRESKGKAPRQLRRQLEVAWPRRSLRKVTKEVPDELTHVVRKEVMKKKTATK
jgi:hypothetical protein